MKSAASRQPDDLKTQLKINKIHENRTIFPVEINHHQQPINMAIFNPSGLLFATCSNDGKLFVYNGVTNALLNTFQIDTKSSAIKFIAFNKTGDKLFGATVDKVFMLDVYRFQDEQIIRCAAIDDYRILDFKLAFGDTSLALVSRFMFSKEELKPGQKLSDVSFYSMDSLLAAYEPLKVKEREQLEFERDRIRPVVDPNEPEALKVTDYVVPMPASVCHLSTDESEFTKVALYLEDHIAFVGKKNASISKFDLKSSTEKPVCMAQLKSTQINNMEFSPRFEFLIVSCNDSINLLDPSGLETIHSFNTKFPVLSGKITPLLYAEQPKYHLIYAGGIAAIEQARTSEGGNEIMIYNFATGKIITKLSGVFGNVNYLDLFKDGSGFITAGQEGVARVYRFDLSYYKDKEFE